MKTKLLLPSAVICAAIAAVFFLTRSRDTSVKMPPIERGEPGWQTFPSPRDFDFPGAMFAIDDHGVRRPWAKAGESFVKQGEISLPVISRAKKWNVDVLLRFLRKESVAADIGANDDLTLDVSLEGGTSWFDPKFESDTLPTAKRSITTWTKGWRYFVVESTEAFRQIQITAQGASGGTVDGHGSLERIANANVSFTANSHGQTSLTRSFEHDFNVFYLARELQAPDPGAFPGTSQVKDRVVNEPLVYRE